MVCSSCGTAVEIGGRFCPHCGAAIAAQPASPPVGYAQYPTYSVPVGLPRVQRHLQTVGILWCVFGAYRIAAALFGFFIVRAVTWRRFGSDWPFGPWGGMHGPAWMGIMPVLVTAAVLMAALAFVAGFGLLNRRPWGRMLTIVLAVLALFKFPFGTALGIYTLWVLAPATSAMEYDSMAESG
jgi:hypothetical protein